jgi:hypothetical protein
VVGSATSEPQNRCVPEERIAQRRVGDPHIGRNTEIAPATRLKIMPNASILPAVQGEAGTGEVFGVFAEFKPKVLVPGIGHCCNRDFL